MTEAIGERSEGHLRSTPSPRYLRPPLRNLVLPFPIQILSHLIVSRVTLAVTLNQREVVTKPIMKGSERREWTEKIFGIGKVQKRKLVHNISLFRAERLNMVEFPGYFVYKHPRILPICHKALHPWMKKETKKEEER